MTSKERYRNTKADQAAFAALSFLNWFGDEWYPNYLFRAFFATFRDFSIIQVQDHKRYLFSTKTIWKSRRIDTYPSTEIQPQISNLIYEPSFLAKLIINESINDNCNLQFIFHEWKAMFVKSAFGKEASCISKFCLSLADPDRSFLDWWYEREFSWP